MTAAAPAAAAALAVFLVLAAPAGTRAAPPGAGGAEPGGGPGGSGPHGEWRLLEAAAASVNGEVIFLSDVAREACFLRCGAFPGDAPADVGLAGARDRYIANVLVLQEQKTLALGEVGDAALREAVDRVRARMARCDAPCASGIGEEDLRDFAARRLLAEDFLAKRVSVFVDVSEEEVRRERERRLSREGRAPGEAEEARVREELLREKTAREIENWYSRAASKSRILLAPLEER